MSTNESIGKHFAPSRYRINGAEWLLPSLLNEKVENDDNLNTLKYHSLPTSHPIERSLATVVTTQRYIDALFHVFIRRCTLIVYFDRSLESDI